MWAIRTVPSAPGLAWPTTFTASTTAITLTASSSSGTMRNTLFGICRRLGSFASTTLAVGSQFNQSNPLWMHTHLIVHPEYKMRFADRVYKYFFNDGVLTPGQCTSRFMSRADQIDLAIIGESARWGDAKRSTPRTRDADWLPDINRMVSTYLPYRTGVVLNQFKSQGWFPNVDAPAFNQNGGWVAAGFSLTITAPTGTVWYTLNGSDPRLKGGAINTSAATAYSGPVTLTKSTHVKARVLSGNIWSALNEAVFAVGPVAESLRITRLCTIRRKRIIPTILILST